MSEKTTELLEKTLQEFHQNLKNKERVEKLEKSMEEYNQMLVSGQLSVRGYNLLSVDKKHLHTSLFNTAI